MIAATPAAIAEALARLDTAGQALRHRHAAETVDALARWLEAWRAPDSPWRGELEKRLPEATGLHPATVRAGLERALAPWTGDALRALVSDELGGPAALDGTGPRLVRGFDTTAALLAGSLPMPTLLALLAPLVLRSPVLAKTAVHDPVTAPLAVRTLGEIDPELGACAASVSFPGDEDACVEALLDAHCVVATGSDATVARVAARMAPPRRFVGHGHRLSLAAVGPEAAVPDARARTSRALAVDVSLWDQLGCLSPVSIYAVGLAPGDVDRLAESLAASLAERAVVWPRGGVPAEAAALAAHERAAAEMRAAAGRPVQVHGGGEAPFCVVREADATPRAAPLHRFVRVHPVADADALLRALRPLARHLAAVAVAGFGGARPALARALAHLGASRICDPGALQAPPLAWRRDNRGVLEPLARFSDLV